MSKILDNIIYNLGNFRKHFKIQLPDGSNNIFLGADSGVTTGIGIWGNSTNKVAIRATNSQDDARYNFLVRQSSLVLTYRPSSDSADTTLYTIPAPSYYFGGSTTTSITGDSTMTKFATVALTKGIVSTSDWSVSNGVASTTQAGVYKVEGVGTFAAASGQAGSVAIRLHVGSTIIVGRGQTASGGTVTVPLSPIIINIAAGTNIFMDCTANATGNIKSENNYTNVVITRVG